METKNGNGNGGGGVAVADRKGIEDMAAVEAALEKMPDGAVRAIRDAIEPEDADDDRAVLMDLLGVLPEKVVKGVRRRVSDYLAGAGSMAGMAMGAAEAENDEGADEVESPAGPPDYGNAGDIKRKVMAAFCGMGDEAKQMLSIYIELMSISGITRCELANEICEALYNDNGEGGKVANAPGALWLSGFHDALDLLNATG